LNAATIKPENDLAEPTVDQSLIPEVKWKEIGLPTLSLGTLAIPKVKTADIQAMDIAGILKTNSVNIPDVEGTKNSLGDISLGSINLPVFEMPGYDLDWSKRIPNFSMLTGSGDLAILAHLGVRCQ